MVNNPGTWAHIYAPCVMRNGTVLPHRPCISVLHVHHGNFHIHLPEKYNFEFSRAAGMKILKRTILIFLIGMGIGWFSRFCYYWTSPTEGIGFGAQLWEAAWTFDRIRILGVMQRLALCYGATAIIALTMKHRNIPISLLPY